jgi:hypothetical protein
LNPRLEFSFRQPNSLQHGLGVLTTLTQVSSSEVRNEMPHSPTRSEEFDGRKYSEGEKQRMGKDSVD